MRRYKFKKKDLYIGAKLICVYVYPDFVFSTVGREYEVDDIDGGRFNITDDDDAGEGCSWTLDELNDTLGIIEFQPSSQFTEKELFIIRLSGRLPIDNSRND